jgi:hypothetical protein
VIEHDHTPEQLAITVAFGSQSTTSAAQAAPLHYQAAGGARMHRQTFGGVVAVYEYLCAVSVVCCCFRAATNLPPR